MTRTPRKYQIVYDKGNRLRLRFGKYAFTKEQGYRIAALLLSLEGVRSVTTSHLNGGILILHEDARDRLLAALEKIELSSLPEPIANPDQVRQEIDHHYQNKIIASFIKRSLLRRLFPAPIGTIVTAVRALGYLKRGLQALSQGRVNVDVLDAASVTASFLYKSPATAASIMFMLGISDTLAEYTKERAKHDLLKSLEIDVDRVWILSGDGTEINIPISELKQGDTLLVRSGSMIPIDGTVSDGYALVNEASMTGEPLAAEKKIGSTVFAGTVVEEGCISIEVRSLTDESRIAGIVQMIERSEQYKAGIQGKAEHLADAIVPFNFMMFGAIWFWTGSFTKALSVLMVDYSCAIKLSTPIAVLSAMREASSNHIVVKGGKFFESIAEADTIVFDKTGTLTMAVPQLEKIVALEGYSRDEVLTIAACLEEHFPHSVARAIVRQAESESLVHPEYHAEVEYIVAHGIASTLNGERAVIGSRHFVLDDERIPIDEATKQKIANELDHLSPIYLALGGRLIGVLGISDPPRIESASIIKALKKSGIKEVIMITGDNVNTAKAISDKLGIDRFYANILPEKKSQIIAKLQSENRKVIMVGDGINDSPALAQADVSVAMKDASDIAREVADVTLLNNTLEDLIKIRRISKMLMQRIRKNYAAIVSFNTMLLGLGLAGLITPNTLALLHNSSTLGISLHSMTPLDPGKKELPAENDATTM